MSEMTIYLAFVTLGTAGLVCALRELCRALDSRHWPLQEAEIVQSGVRAYRGGHLGTTFGPNVRYKYEREGVVYEGTRIMFSGLGLSTFSRHEVEQFLAPLAKGTRILVRVSPRNPRISVIEPGVDRRLDLSFFVSTFLLSIGFGGLRGWWA